MSHTNTTTPTLSVAKYEDDSPNMDHEKDVNPNKDGIKSEKDHDPDRMEKGASNGKVTIPVADSEEHEIVKWDEGEPANPQNWSAFRKWTIVIIVSMGSFCATTCSSMVASTYQGIEEEFHVSGEVATLGLTLYISGLGLGPLFLGPLSEFFGRSPIYNWSYLFFVLFNIPVALAKNIQTWLIGRFLSGVSGSAFLSVAGGSVSDMFRGKALSMPMAFFSASPFLGPVIGPIIAGFINQHTSWRWTWYVQIIWAFVEWLLLVFLVPETYEPKLLHDKAIRLRKEGGPGSEICKSRMEVENKKIGRTILLSVTVPFKLVAKEPMALALNIWTSLLLGILYMFFSAFPIVFSGHGFTLQEKGLTFIGIGIGIVLATACNPLFMKRYVRTAQRLGRQPPPEEHLVKGLYGAVLCPVALFWFAFTTYPKVHWIVPIIASIPFGFGMVLAYSSTFTFLVDAYRPYAASAMASNSFMRSATAAAFPLFTTQMYHKLGTDWASALCGFLLVALAPFPFLFYKYGHKLRKGSKYCIEES